MAKLGAYSYPDIRFGDAVEIAGRILTKFKGTVSVKGLAWELGMAEGSGTLFAKVAAMRDFGLVEGRGELRITPLAQRVLYPSTSEEGQEARAEAFQRVDLLRQLYERFEGEVPDDMSLLVGLEEITRSPRDEIVRRSPLIQKQLTDAIRVLGRPVTAEKNAEYSGENQQLEMNPLNLAMEPRSAGFEGGVQISAAGRHLSVPLSAEYIDVAISLLETIKKELESGRDTEPLSRVETDETQPETVQPRITRLPLGTMDQFDVSSGAKG
ncbi:MAG: hypothetical protein WD533_01460 [Dehalococcoidia bacterium]